MVAITLTICFETPYWIGVFEQVDSGKLRVCKVIFGAEPKDYQVYEWLLMHYDSLNFSKPISIETKKQKS